jgi:ABC-type glycerol-3-phosphate transport system permease component
MTAQAGPDKAGAKTFRFEGLLGGPGQWILHIILMTIGFIYIFPFIWMLGTAFKTPSEFFSLGINPFPAGEWQWSNFVNAWVKANFGRYFLNSVIISVGVTALVVLFTSMAAYALTRLRVPFAGLILGFIVLTMFLPSGYTIIPTVTIVQRLGMLNSLGAVILVLVAGGMVFNTLLFYGYMRTMPREIEEAAVIDGASVHQRFRNVILPMSAPMIATVSLFTFMSTWNDFFVSLVFTLARPELRTLAVGMYAFVGQASRDWTLLCAAATISILPIIFIYVMLQERFTEAFAGAVKS